MPIVILTHRVGSKPADWAKMNIGQKSGQRFLVIAGMLLLSDWVLGAGQANGAIPIWTFAVANFPLGLLFVWFEAQWTGSYYLVFGHRVGDLESLVVFFAVVLAQAVFYWWLWEKRLSRRSRLPK